MSRIGSFLFGVFVLLLVIILSLPALLEIGIHNIEVTKVERITIVQEVTYFVHKDRAGNSHETNTAYPWRRSEYKNSDEAVLNYPDCSTRVPMTPETCVDVSGTYEVTLKLEDGEEVQYRTDDPPTVGDKGKAQIWSGFKQVKQITFN